MASSRVRDSAAASCFPFALLAIAAAGRRWKKRATIEVVDLADEPLLLLNRDFGTRQLSMLLAGSLTSGRGA